VEAIKLEPLSIHPINTLTKYGDGLKVNGIVITAIVNLQLLQNDKNKKMLIDLNIKENMLELKKSYVKEQVSVHGVQIIYLMVHVNIHNFITLVNTLMMILWLILLNYVLVVIQRKHTKLHLRKENGIQ